MIEDVVPNSYSQDRPSNDYSSIEEEYDSAPPQDYKVSSAPAFGSPSNRRDSYVESPYGYQVSFSIQNYVIVVNILAVHINNCWYYL